MQDPIGILNRIPELLPLAEADAQLRNALATGDPHKVYRALWWARILGRHKAQRALIDDLLQRRRLFMKPITSAPMLFTFNGMGARIYGLEAEEADKSYIATHFFTIVYIPIIPLSQYLVRDGEKNSYHFFGKVPFSSEIYLWRSAVMGLLGLGILSGAASAWTAYNYVNLHLINGFAVPLIAEVDGVSHPLPSGELKLSVETGEVRVIIRSQGGEEIEHGSLTAKAGTDLVVWNVAGAAPVYIESVGYASSTYKAKLEEPPIEILCGQQQVVRDGIDYPFQEPPKSVSMSKNDTVVWKTQAALDPGGWVSCGGWMSQQENHKGLLELAQRALTIEEEIQSLGQATNVIIGEAGVEEATRLVQEALKKRDLINLHRIHQDFELSLGHKDALIQEYDALLAQQPESGDRNYLRLRLEPPDKALPGLEAAVKRWPDHAQLAINYAYTLLWTRHFEEAVAAWERAARLSAEVVKNNRLERVEAFVATGQIQSAQKLLISPTTEEEALVAWRLGQLAGEKTEPELPKAVWQTSEQPEMAKARFKAILGKSSADMLKKMDAADQAKLALIIQVPLDPKQALQAAHAAPELLEFLAELPLESRVLLYGEARREADTAAVAALSRLVDNEIIEFISNNNSIVLSQRLSIVAAAELARAIQPEVSASERAQLRESARKDDFFHGIVTDALEHWPG